MKKSIPPFLAGVLSAVLVGSLTLSALAISGRMTIEVDPINIQVNGQTFQPKDANGNDVAVFAYNGTTYAPLRALAEAYGLEVGYNSETNMATVVDPENRPAQDPKPDTAAPTFNWSAEEEAAYQEFKGMWEYDTSDKSISVAEYKGSLQISALINEMKEYSVETLVKYGLRIYEEITGDVSSIQWDTVNPTQLTYTEILNRSGTNHINFQYDERILFAVHPDGGISFGSAWSAGY